MKHPGFRPWLRQWLTWTVLALALTPALAQAQMQRIKDIASIEGVRSNQLTGYGIVIGLDGTGDQSAQMPYTGQSMANYLQQLGISLPANGQQAPQLRNVAAVIVTAQLPAFARPGQTIDVVVSSIGNAKSLKGGMLISTPLKGVDGEIYALAQGNLVIAGAGASQGGTSVQVNHLSAGRIPNGAQVERTVPTPLLDGLSVNLNLNANDFQTASRVAEAINTHTGRPAARALDGRTVEVQAPVDANQRVAFLAQLEELPLETVQPPAKVVINARTGSIVLNQSVSLSPSAIAHGNLSVVINSTPVISQPAPFSQGQTVVTEKTDIQIAQEGGAIIALDRSAKLIDVVNALNALGATPQDLLSILQALKSAGALHAELEII